jgi:hypothetical protein
MTACDALSSMIMIVFRNTAEFGYLLIKFSRDDIHIGKIMISFDIYRTHVSHLSEILPMSFWD